MKKIFLILIVIAPINNLFCQSFEWEIINAGFASGFSKDKNGYYNELGGALTFGTAIRYNLKEKQLSPGLQFTFSGWNRDSPVNNDSYHQNAFVFLVTTDYNYTNISPKFIPFAGIGIGNSLMREWGSSITGITYNSHFAFSPRIGFEFFKRLRFTSEYMYLGNGNNFFNFKLGFIIGS
ncbi:hypothetical protein FACS189451_01400 [Bacteroidia bacterium]|nr:hypothetical protein FACS189451_01400 [Bacteroidia bacterium]